MATQIPSLMLANGVAMPVAGLGVYRSGPEDTLRAVGSALRLGYRLIDTAAAYGNEAQVGESIRRSGIARETLFVTTKLWISDYGYDRALHGFDRSLGKLGLETVDLYLLHWPMPGEWARTVASWKAAARLLAEGRVRAIGVSNFSPGHLAALIAQTDVTPMVNQIELHPFFTQRDLRAADERLGIVTQAWSPIGGVNRYFRDAPDAASDPLSHPVITGLAARHGRTPAQIVLRWQIEHGVSVIPKSVRDARIAENIAIFDFALSTDEVAAIDALDSGARGGPDPEKVDTALFSFTVAD